MTTRTPSVPFGTLLGLEWRKNRAEPSLWLALVLYVTPAVMVIAADVVNASDRPAEDTYFIFHNQTMLVLPLAAGSVATAVMRVELANGTWFSWLMTGTGVIRLWSSKLVFIGAMQALFTVFAMMLFMPFFLITTDITEASTLLLRTLAAYGILNTIVAVFMTLFVATILILWRNSVTTMAVLIVITVSSLIIMAAEFSWVLPPAFAYRLGLSFISDEYFYTATGAGIGGALVTVLSLLMLVTVQYLILRHNRPRRLLD